jgi:uncharacterized SAM-binding protein YcdF (DUF218 family)
VERGFSTVKTGLVLAFRRLVFSLGLFSLFLFILSFTDLPYNAYHWLGTTESGILAEPDVIVVLGGAGMPSPDGLIRTYYAAQLANTYPRARITIALPYTETDSLQQLNLMAHELIVRGVDSLRIGFEPLGFNTRTQALNIARSAAGALKHTKLLLVSSPEHVYRAVKTFRKAGFSQVMGFPAFEQVPDAEKIKDKDTSPDLRVKSLSLRYNMWSYLHYEILVLREYTAIVYYKLKGWM